MRDHLLFRAVNQRLVRACLAATLLGMLLPWPHAAACAGTGDLLANTPAYDVHALNNAASGVVAAAMVLQFYRAEAHPAGAPLTLTAVSAYVKEWSWAPGHPAGTTATQLARGLAAASAAPALAIGLPLVPTWHHTDATGWRARLATEIGRGHPVIVSVPDGGRFWGNAWHYGHYLVVSGLGADGSIIYHDPWSGQAYSVSAAAFGAAWGTPFRLNQGWWYLVAAPSAAVVAQATVVARATGVARLQATVAARSIVLARTQATAVARETAAAVAQAAAATRGTAVVHAHATAASRQASEVAQVTPGHTSSPHGGGGPTLWVTISPPEFMGSGLNLRVAPSTTAPVRLLILDREPVSLLGAPVRGANGHTWDRVLYHGLTGYVDAEFLSPRQPAPGPVVAEFPLPNDNSQPIRLILGPDGNLWFVEFTGGRIGRFHLDPDGTPSSQGIEEFALPSGNDPSGITAGPDGNIWFTDPTAHTIGWVTMDGQLHECPSSAGSDPVSITAGPDGNLWFTDPKHDLIGRVGTDCSYAFASLPTGSDPEHITAGPDGNLWFTEGKGDAIGSIAPGSGQVTEYAVHSPGSDPDGIVAGPGGVIWFTERSGNNIGQMWFWSGPQAWRGPGGA